MKAAGSEDAFRTQPATRGVELLARAPAFREDADSLARAGRSRTRVSSQDPAIDCIARSDRNVVDAVAAAAEGDGSRVGVLQMKTRSGASANPGKGVLDEAMRKVAKSTRLAP
jgi:hypothetical protein